MKIIQKILKISGLILAVVISAFIAFLVYINLPVAKINQDAKLGITFSSRYATDIGLNWKENFVAILDDLRIRKIRIPVYWDLVEPRAGEYDFADLDWQLQEAEKRNAEIVLTVGQKVPRWPECHIPKWVPDNRQSREAEILGFIEEVVKRYRDGHPEIRYWQVENEPFLPFGICPDGTISPEAVGAEVSLVRKLDPGRKIIVTDSGELSLWYKAASYADVFGTTMYRTIFKEGIGYYDYPIGPRFFWVKFGLIKLLAGQNNAIVIELQAEPWINGWTTHAALSEQFKSMDAARLRDNVEFAKKVGFPEIYLWGAEWWYWLKATQNHPELWETARELYNE